MPTPFKPMALFDRLLRHYGARHWWPAKTPFEVIVGAVLTQNTAWGNVEKAIANLRRAKLLAPKALYAAPVEQLAALIRPCGYYNLKAVRLRNVVALIVERYGGSLKRMFSTPLAELREELLAINGVGPETADSILLYAGGLPSFVVDAYTHRVLKRHGWIDRGADYHAIKRRFEESLPADPALYNEFHALLVHVGNRHCRKTPRCEECPLRNLLPGGAPLAYR